MKKYILLALVMCRCVLVLGVEAPKKSTDANIFGHVVDRDTHEHIPYATIAVTGTAFGTTTDASGHYFLKNLPEGALTLEVRALGYASQTQQVTLRRGQTAELNFEVVQSGISMDEVVVSASRSARLRREAPALVSVLDAGLFEKTNASCLAQGLSFQPGVRVEDDCQNCGFTQVRINGLDGHYSQILVDSHPVFSADGRIRPGTDPGQHDRAGRGAARRRLGAVRVVGHRRHDQRHYEGAFAQFGADVAYAHFDRRQQFL
mgnify:CR=1 FL=1